jgi:COMPASS component SWD2
MTSLSFSNNGKYILVGTASHVHYVLEAFSLSVVCRLEGHAELGRDASGNRVYPKSGISGQEVSWSPDSQFIFSGMFFPPVTLALVTGASY